MKNKRKTGYERQKIWEEKPELLEYLLKWYEHFGAGKVSKDLDIDFEIVRSKSNSYKLRMLPADERLCYTCRENKCFIQNNGRSYAYCRECSNKSKNEKRRTIFKLDPLKERLSEIKRTITLRSKKKYGIITDIDLEYLYELYNNQNGKCAYSGITMTASDIVGNGRSSTSISIDRIDSNKGYVKENVVLVCWKVNAAKSDLTMVEFIEMCKAVCENFKI